MFVCSVCFQYLENILENIRIDATKDIYVNKENVELEAKNINYKTIKFNYYQIKEILASGGEILIKNEHDELLYTLNKELIKNENDCNVNLNGVTGIYIEVNNIQCNGQIDLEITKSIGLCNYPREVFKDITQYLISRNLSDD